MKNHLLKVVVALLMLRIVSTADAQVFDFSSFGLGQSVTVNGSAATEANMANFTVNLLYGSSEGSLSTISFALTDLFWTSGAFIGPSKQAVPGFSVGQAPVLKVQIFETSAGSFQNAAVRGESSFFSTTLSVNDAGTPANKMTVANDPVYSRGFQGFNIAAVPEPTTIALGVLGGLGLLARRRRNAKA